MDRYHRSRSRIVRIVTMSTNGVLLVLLALCLIPHTPVRAQSLNHAPSARYTADATIFTAHDACATYVVQPGDWLSRVFPNTWATIAAINHLANPNLIYPNEVLCVTAAPSPTQTTPPQQAPAPAIALPAPVSSESPREPCQSTTYWAATIWQWAIPPSCFGGVYYEGHGDCAGWVTYLHGEMTSQMHVITGPVPGAVAHLAPGVQGAGSGGHYVQIIAINGPWMLISEENDSWRGGGWNMVMYRYISMSGGITYLE